jgi:hypothetical protein
MSRFISARDHPHPEIAVGNQSSRKRRPRRILRTIDSRLPPLFQKILQRFPSQLVRELKRLHQTLTLQIAQPPLPRQSGGASQLPKSLLEIPQSLNPPHIRILHSSNSPTSSPQKK